MRTPFRFLISVGLLVSLSTAPAPAADFDGDGDVDVNDFLTFANCYNGALLPPRPECQNPHADLDGDDDVDINDFLTFSNCFNGSSNPPNCTLPVYADLTLTIGNVDGAILPLLGVNAGPTPSGQAGNADVTAGYQQIGVNAVRNHDFYGPLDMPTMYPDRALDPTDSNSFDFASSDPVFAAILAGAFQPYFRLGDSWNDIAPPSGAAERANWVQAAVEVIRHYHEGQWSGFSGSLQHIEIWNEPNSTHFWPAPFTQTEFFELFADAVAALQAAFPDLDIGGPGVSPAAYKAPAGRQWTEDFLDYMQAHGVALDFFSWHMYANYPNDFTNAAIYFRGQLDARGYTATELHCTEWNTATKNLSQQEIEELRLGERGSSVMTAAWIALQDEDITVSTFYRGTDTSPTFPTFYGVFHADGTPKLIARAFDLWSDLADHPDRLAVTAAPANGSVRTLAGQNGAGRIALLITNFSDAATTWDIAFGDGRQVSDYTVSVRQVNDTSDGTTPFTPTGSIVDLPAYTVQLLTLTP